MVQFDVKGGSCAAGTSTTVFNGRTRLKALTVSATTADATVAVKDNATTLFTYTATGTGPVHILVPGDGVVCQTSLVVTCAAGVTAVAFYG